MNYKKKSWEYKYEGYISGEADKEARKLKRRRFSGNEPEKIQKAKTKYKMLEKHAKVKANLSKVTNILELRDKLQTKKIELIEEIKARKDYDKAIENADKKFDKLEKELQEKNNKKLEIKSKLKDKNLEEEQRNKLESELSKIENDINKNNEEFAKNQETIDKLNDGSIFNSKFKDVSDEELDIRKAEVSNKISKCNFVCKNLMDGKDWDTIELQLENWQDRHFTSKEKLSRKAEKVKIEENDIENSQDYIDNEVDDKLENKIIENQLPNKSEYKDNEFDIIIDNKEDIQEEVEQEKALINSSEFEQKHPRLAKITNWFKNIFKGNKTKGESFTEFKDRMTNAIPEEFNNRPLNENIEQANEKSIVEEQKTQRDEFTEYLKIVSEKGMEKIAQERLEEMKKEAINRQNEKFGQDYSKKSRDER